MVDNAGDYEQIAEEEVLRPGSNLGWAEGCNFGVQSQWSRDHRVVVLLNNDTRLSPGFFSGLQQALRRTSAKLLGPAYDHIWPQQQSGYSGPAIQYISSAHEVSAPFVDGTCMVIPKTTIEQVGLIDAASFPRYQWGCDKDYALRVRAAGGEVWVTHRSYLNHDAHATAKLEGGDWQDRAQQEMQEGMIKKWGANWERSLWAGWEMPILTEEHAPWARDPLLRGISSLRGGEVAL